MKIAVINEYFAEKMGYSDFFLCKALAEAGHDVHLVTSDLHQPFPNYQQSYEPFLGPRRQSCGSKPFNGFMLHRLPAGKFLGKHETIVGLCPFLRQLRPDVVQTIGIMRPSSFEIAWLKLRMGFVYFTEAHVHASVFGPDRQRATLGRKIKWLGYKATLGSFFGAMIDGCQAISPDCGEIAAGFFGVPRSKLTVFTLASDPGMFHPAQSEADLAERAGLRLRFGFAPDDVVCIYTGRLSRDKDPQCLAKAIAILRNGGHRFKGLFVGNGPKDDIAAIQACDGCAVGNFVPMVDLPPYYRAADIGVWPRQESTSQLDAMSTGLPLVLSDSVKDKSRYDGNGLTYAEGDPDALAAAIGKLHAPESRASLGGKGREKVVSDFNWGKVAATRTEEYQSALSRLRKGMA